MPDFQDLDQALLYEAYVALVEDPPDTWPDPKPGESPKKVALVGKSPGAVAAPWGEEGWEIWGLNDISERPYDPPLRSHTRWFQLHPPHYLEVHYPQGIEALDEHWGRDRGMPCYMDRHYEQYPSSVPFPKAEVEALTTHGAYHTSSFDWMIALAVLEGFTTIRLCGVDFFTFPAILNGEPLAARPCMEYWTGVAEGRGATVEVYQFGHMFKTIQVGCYVSDLQYGFEREPMLDFKKAIAADNTGGEEVEEIR